MEGGCAKAPKDTATAQYRPVPATMPATMSRAYSFGPDPDPDVVLQELGISPAYAEGPLHMTGGDVNEAAALAFSDWTADAAAAAGDDSPPLSYTHPHPHPPQSNEPRRSRRRSRSRNQ
jgi:hypothetical protein